MLEQGEIPQANPEPVHAGDLYEPLKDAYEETVALEMDQEEDTDDGDSSTNMHDLPLKNPRGRKSKKKKREEEAILVVMDGSQKMLKGIVKNKSKKGTPLASKGANPTIKSQ